MTLGNPSCSESGVRQHPVLVLEGMPGAGKTTAAGILAAENHLVVAEYTDLTGGVIPVQAHPVPADDTGHQHNWLRKHHQIQTARHTGPIFCDRDWLTALAYAHSIADTDDGALFTSRAHWAWRHLATGDLAVPTSYVIFLVDPVVSLRRRTDRLTPHHPWSSLPGVIRLASFYTDPIAWVGSVHPELAARLRRPSWHRIADYTLEQSVRFLRDLADHR